MRTNRFKTYKSLWVRKTSQYCDRYGEVFFAKVVPCPYPLTTYQTLNYPRPDKVEHLISAVLEPGGPRHYCFELEGQRDEFVSNYREFATADGSLRK